MRIKTKDHLGETKLSRLSKISRKEIIDLIKILGWIAMAILIVIIIVAVATVCCCIKCRAESDKNIEKLERPDLIQYKRG